MAGVVYEYIHPCFYIHMDMTFVVVQEYFNTLPCCHIPIYLIGKVSVSVVAVSR
jgi:hypothetical protein